MNEKENRLDEAEKRFNQGLDLRKQGNFNESIEKLVEAKTIFQRFGREAEVAECNLKIGTTLHEQGKVAEAIGYFEAAMIIYERMNMPGASANPFYFLLEVVKFWLFVFLTFLLDFGYSVFLHSYFELINSMRIKDEETFCIADYINNSYLNTNGCSLSET